MKRLAVILMSALLCSCGMAESDQDERNRYIYTTFTDSAFGEFCLERYDLNEDGRVSRYEAQRILDMDCSGMGIESLWDIREFSRLRSLNCSGNNLSQLDLRGCTLLRTVYCGNNALTTIDIGGISGLTTLDCSDNNLSDLKLATASLSRLLCGKNNLVTLDLRSCAVTLNADVRGNPSLSTVYALATQNVSIDGATEVILP